MTTTLHKADALLRYRDRFPILQSTKYLVSHSLGAMPEAAREALEEFADTWATRGVRAWGDSWWTMSIDAGDVIAPLLGVPAGSVTMLPNVTTAEAVVLSSFEFQAPRNRVVLVEGEFPSVRYVYDRLARRFGAEIVTVAYEDLLDTIDERTELVPMSHVFFESSLMADVPAIARRSRDVGATLVLDVFQSAGILPVELQKWGVTIAVGGVLKWLCGGPGGSFLYVDPELRPRLEPAFTGWMAHAQPFGFEAPPMRFRDDALRFALGTPPIPALYAAREGPKIVAEAGIERIREKSSRQTRRFMDLADARGFEVRTPRDPERRGGTVSIVVPHAREVSRELNRNDILCDFRPASGIRFSPHFYTTDEEIDAAFDAIDDILESGRWTAHASSRTIVT
ncbi:MAG TPA: aminotransferase class V-fold PLP-dependent enzyme [Thermoanaerobaculia bacterium]|nr:aminotransferase class V-fold PLP-dependent enzyme [Thermoanaerobaculia bacterium]